MPISRKRPIGPKAARPTRGPTRPRTQSAVKRVLGLVLSITFILGVASRGLEPESRAEPVALQEPTTATPSPAKTPGAAPLRLDTAALRAETVERLKVLEASAAPNGKASTTGTASSNPTSGSVAGSVPSRLDREARSNSRAATTDPAVDKSIRELLHDRLLQLEEYDKLCAALHQATHPDPSPERQAIEAKADLERLQTIITQAAKAPETLLPSAFRGSSNQISTRLTSEMKDALEATTKEWKEWKLKIETVRSLIANWDTLQKARRTERDKLFQRVATLKAKTKEFEATVADAQTAHARQLAQERLVNLECVVRMESLRLQVLEAQIGLEVKLAGVRELNLHIHRAHIQIGERTLEQMRVRYRVAAEDQDRDLKRAAANEETKAQWSHDPLERFRARHSAELLVIEALVLKSEQALATSPSPSPEEQRSLADRADKDFAEIKGLLDDGRVSRLDAIRLNNDFRRIGPERDRLLRNEMATVEAQLQYYEDSLTGVELELIQDSLHNRFEQDLLRERVPPSRRSQGEGLVSELERKHRALLVRRREALEKLSERAAHTLQQVVRRLGILDEEYGFIRTHIFWVRDQDPIGLATLAQGAREFNYLLNGLLRLAEETVKANLWGRPSAEFLATALAVLALPILLVRLRQALRGLIQRENTPEAEGGSHMRALRSLALKLTRAAIWPVYLLLAAYAARVGPWPRSLGILVSAILTAVAMATLFHDLLRWLVWAPAGAERYLDLPQPVARQLDRAGRFLVVAALALMLPVYLFDHELIAPEGRPVTAPALSRLLVIGYELLVWGTCVQLLRRSSALLEWLGLPRSSPPELESADSPLAPTSAELTAMTGVGTSQPAVSSRVLAGLAWLGRRRRLVACLVLAAIGSIIILDVRGYSFTARRLAVGGSKTAVVITLAVAAYRAIGRAISRNAWRWARPSRSWAMALTSAVALRASARSRGTVPWSVAEPSISPADSADPDDDAVSLDDLAAGLRRLSAYAVVVLTLLATAWIWDFDMALVRFLLSQSLWSLDGQTPVTLGDVTKATVVILLGALAWRYMSTLFAVTIFPRMPDDPGVRFAVVTLCRYSVLGLATISALGAIHLDLARIGVVLAALGVGLGFGLQEIVSNFVCGIILLLERPIRIGDVVTVAGTTGKVDRINIRATTIINSDNQSMIVPNREFITGNLVNWTLKDKILRVPIKIAVAYGTDPDRVVDLLLKIARQDADVLLNPAPAAVLEGFGDSALLFGLYTFVPDPSLAGGVRHRLCTEVQRRFVEEGIVIPFPTHELHLNRVPPDLTRALESSRDDPVQVQPHRYDPASRTPPAPHGLPAAREAGEQALHRVKQ